jgi:benzoyl-CoA reductase/2-hydroxyglutaryl-CoA dehydratase subunit BcrC/BadD/HgdB
MPMKRKEYLVEQKEKGRRLLGVFPAQYPKEILWAMNVLPAEIWDPPLELTMASAHLQTYICSVVKLGMELVLQGKCDFLDGFLFPHTCDSIQNMASVIHDYVRADKPCYFGQGVLSESFEGTGPVSGETIRPAGPGSTQTKDTARPENFQSIP